MAITQKYSLDLVPKNIPLIVHCSQYDSSSRNLVFTIFNDGILYEIPSESVVTIRGTKKDNKGFEYECTFEGSEVTAILEEQMTMYSGSTVCELRFVLSGEILGTANFILEVEKTSLASDIDISDTDLPLLEKAIQSANEAKSYAESAKQTAESLDELVPINEGTNGQVLTREDNTTSWQDIEAENVKYNNTSSGINADNIQSAIDAISKSHRTLTQSEYNALSTAEKNNGTIYFITD